MKNWERIKELSAHDAASKIADLLADCITVFDVDDEGKTPSILTLKIWEILEMEDDGTEK